MVRRITNSATVTADETAPGLISFDATGSIVGTAGLTDNALIRADGIGGGTVQGSGVIVDDGNNISGIVALQSVPTNDFNFQNYR
jgi:hypothetical protein